jgi:hypothetical protein
MKTTVLQVRVAPAIKVAFEQVARSSSFGNASALLDYLVNQAIGQLNQGVEVGIAPPLPSHGPKAYIGTRLSLSETIEVKTLAKGFGGVSPWLRGLCLKAIGKAEELPSTDELLAFHQATTELWHVGKNLNQIARHMNEDRRAGTPVNFNGLKPELIDRLAKAFENLAQKNVALVAKTRKRGVING